MHPLQGAAAGSALEATGYQFGREQVSVLLGQQQRI